MLLDKKSNFDYVTFILYTFLVLGGMLMLYVVERPPDGYTQDLAGMLDTFVGKQFVWLIISLGAWFVINTLVDRDVWIIGAYPVYGITVLLLILVLVLGKEINNARSWFSLFGFTFQPGELAKFGTCLAMAAFLSQWTEKMDRVRTIGYGVLIWAVPAVLIVLQPDPGTALVFTSFFLVMYREGLPGLLLLFGLFTAAMFLMGTVWGPGILTTGLLSLLLVVMSFYAPRRYRWWLVGSLIIAGAAFFLYREGYKWPVLGGLAGSYALAAGYHLLRRNGRMVLLTTTALVWGTLIVVLSDFTFNNVLRPHQQNRIKAWLDPGELSEQGALYNIVQSKMAIAGGGLSGKGRFGGTMTKYDYVPEQETDFIFSVVGEAEGFLGSFAVIIGFLALLWRITVIAERQPRTFTRAYAYGVAGIIFLHMLVNIGMTMGLMPVIGIPLPFISKGGSSLLSFTIMLAVLLKFDRHRKEV
ncbi:MAG: rod shape-determining protein RodA [Bacteroidota bacterium]